MPTIQLSEIKIGDRRREDHGDVESLANSMRDVGLIHPVVLDSERNLVCGGRRVAAAKILGWDEIEYRDFGSLTPKELRLVELEENIRRKDLTAYERSKNLVEMEGVVSDVLREESQEKQVQEMERALDEGGFLYDSYKKPPGRPRGADKPDSQAKIAARLGVDQPDISEARHHVETAEQFPFMQNVNWKQYHVLEARKHLEKMPDTVRQTAAGMVSLPSLPPEKALDMLQTLGEMPTERLEKVANLFESPDTRDQAVALAEAARIEAMPDSRLVNLDTAADEYKRAIRSYPKDEDVGDFKELLAQNQRLAEKLQAKHRARVAQVAFESVH